MIPTLVSIPGTYPVRAATSPAQVKYLQYPSTRLHVQLATMPVLLYKDTTYEKVIPLCDNQLHSTSSHCNVTSFPFSDILGHKEEAILINSIEAEGYINVSVN